MTRVAWILGFAWGTTVFALWLLALVSADEPKDCGPVGTDWYYECTTGEPIDLTPLTEDEADTYNNSQERN